MVVLVVVAMVLALASAAVVAVAGGGGAGGGAASITKCRNYATEEQVVLAILAIAERHTKSARMKLLPTISCFGLALVLITLALVLIKSKEIRS